MKLAAQFGLITGVCIGIWTHFEYIYGVNHNSFGGLAGFIPHLMLFAGIGIGIFLLRSSSEFGLGCLSFKDGARAGVVISLITGLCLAVYAMLHGLVINPDYLLEYIAFMKESMEEANLSGDVIDQEIAKIKEDGTVGRLMFSKFTVTLVIGMVGSFIIAGMLKKEPTSLEQ